MRIEKVTCDGCGRDLTTRSNSIDYRLVLASESKPGYGPGAYTDMMIYPAIERTHHFCDLACLDLWRDREKHQNALSRAWYDEWKEAHGTKDASGRVRSWQSPPSELEHTKQQEFAAAALAAFPMKNADFPNE